MATIPKDVPTRTSRRAPKRPARQASSRGLNWGRLVAEGRAARASADAGRWRIGHLASLVVKQYGSRSVQQFADDIGESYATVRRYRWVVTRYEPTIRFRFQQLSFSHFQAVAGLPDRVRWLERAESGCWSVDQLVKESRRGTSPSGRKGGATARNALRTPIREASAHLGRLASLDDGEFAKASKWLEPALDELSDEIGRLRDRIRTVRGVRVGRYAAKSNGNGHPARGNGNGHRSRTRSRA